MKRSTRGAARVSAVWMISVGVLFLVSVAFAFISQSDLAKSQTELDAALAARSSAVELTSEQADLKRSVSQVLGWFDPASADPTSDVAAAKQAISDLRTTFTDITDSDDTFQEVLPKVTAAFNQKGRTISELQTRIQGLEGELAAAQQATRDVTSQKDSVIQQLRGEKADEAGKYESRISELETRLATATNNFSDKDQELRELQAKLRTELKSKDQDLAARDTRINELARVTRFTKEPFSDYPDGKIVAVSEKLRLAWINLGSNNRLTRGTRFRVESNTPGVRRFKAYAEVSKVEANRAEVVLMDVQDPFDPVVTGDLIVNRLYDPTGGRNAVLVGRFSGAFNKNELELLLERMGINVQDKLDLTTHFLIVGSELYNDPETNEPLEEPLRPSDLGVFKDAEAQGVQIVPLQDIREFFRIDSGGGSGQ